MSVLNRDNAQGYEIKRPVIGLAIPLADFLSHAASHDNSGSVHAEGVMDIFTSTCTINPEHRIRIGMVAERVAAIMNHIAEPESGITTGECTVRMSGLSEVFLLDESVQNGEIVTFSVSNKLGLNAPSERGTAYLLISAPLDLPLDLFSLVLEQVIPQNKESYVAYGFSGSDETTMDYPILVSQAAGNPIDQLGPAQKQAEVDFVDSVLEMPNFTLNKKTLSWLTNAEKILDGRQ